ncbi:hypothetical protein CH063_09210 [Colletotrichum higginsianum]|uniref:Uncharacterized protein n=1 Tax=Colletotrichum higginsianum (strain IMI 349063) TaxID=759273 RepID=H1VCQ1_COLHI|nr:hypothetical protein CH063_09210 [Colletotrichum higginsianum]
MASQKCRRLPDAGEANYRDLALKAVRFARLLENPISPLFWPHFRCVQPLY